MNSFGEHTKKNENLNSNKHKARMEQISGPDGDSTMLHDTYIYIDGFW